MIYIARCYFGSGVEKPFRNGEKMKQNRIKVCSNCKHQAHIESQDKKIGGGCNAIVYVEPLKGGGYYHEQCDCDYEEK